MSDDIFNYQIMLAVISLTATADSSLSPALITGKPLKTSDKNIINEVYNSQIKAANIRNMNDSFSATLIKLIDARRASKTTKKLDSEDAAKSIAEKSAIGNHTLSRLRTKNGEDVSLQMILGICCGLGLSLAETEMLLDKSPFRLQPTIPEHYAYKSIIPLFKDFSIPEINEILDAAGIRRIGNAKDIASD